MPTAITPPSRRAPNASQSTAAGRDGVSVTGKSQNWSKTRGRRSHEELLKAGEAGVRRAPTQRKLTVRPILPSSFSALHCTTTVTTAAPRTFPERLCAKGWSTCFTEFIFFVLTVACA